SHMDFPPDNLRSISEEQRDRFHQDIKDIERKYQGGWDKNMHADYCWMLTRDRNCAIIACKKFKPQENFLLFSRPEATSEIWQQWFSTIW
ncbi:hypothetical protein NPIL_468461, partial [Nephila pilipes]